MVHSRFIYRPLLRFLCPLLHYTPFIFPSILLLTSLTPYESSSLLVTVVLDLYVSGIEVNEDYRSKPKIETKDILSDNGRVV